MAWFILNKLEFRRAFLLAALAGLVVSSCGPNGSQTTIGDERNLPDDAKVLVEAYLFDAVLKRDGKTTSFRLEMYASDTAVALAGRGYLGKGSLRGIMGVRSLQAYFPTTNEYVDEAYALLLSDSSCTLNLSNFDPVRFMFAIPDSVSIDSLIRVVEKDRGEKRREYLITSHCHWSLSLIYDLRPGGWRPLELTYDDGKTTSLKAVRREYRPGARVKRSKFSFSFPPHATRLLP